MLSNNLSLLFPNKTYYKIHNRIRGNIKFKTLLNEEILKPVEQRLILQTKVNAIIDYQDTFYKTGHNYFNFQGGINIHCCKETKKNYIIDGQHRLAAIEILFDKHKYKNGDVDIEIIEVDTYKEMKENYAMLNKHTELPEFPDDIDKNIPETVANYFFNTYPKVWKAYARKPPRPYVNMNHFQEALAFLTQKLKDKLNVEPTVEDLKKIIKEKNEKMSKWPIESYRKNIRKIKKWPEYKEKSDEFGFYLGMYPQTSEEYTYGWVKDIVNEMTGEVLKKQKKPRKKTIPKGVRDHVWEKYMGKITEAPCFCCRKTHIRLMNGYECGHVESEATGGDMSIENLRPICSSCNKSMGIKNMREYIKNNYPKNLDAFDNNISPLMQHINIKKKKKSSWTGLNLW